MTDKPNALTFGDNIDFLGVDIPAASVDLIYHDPPFNSNRASHVLYQSRSGSAARPAFFGPYSSVLHGTGL